MSKYTRQITKDDFDNYSLDVDRIFSRSYKGWRSWSEVISAAGFTQEPSRWDEEENPTLPIEYIPVDQLIAGQQSVVGPKVKEYLESFDSFEEDGPPIIAIELNDGYMVWNGHHRASCHILTGKDKIKARVYHRPAAEAQLGLGA